jgi:hypothetical protein
MACYRDNFTPFVLTPTTTIIKSTMITGSVLWVPPPQDIDSIPLPRWAEVRKINNDHVWIILNIAKEAQIPNYRNQCKDTTQTFSHT